jgi:hypothetical protein
MTQQQQLVKQAEAYAEVLRDAKRQGFVVQSTLQEKTAQEIERLYPVYVKLDQKREARYEGIRRAIRGN